ncbi:MAG TPA: cupin domain-containing protein [Planctomycetota bacterium]|nr:cupin domain-containing protein [Planctomycetota bacterium]
MAIVERPTGIEPVHVNAAQSSWRTTRHRGVSWCSLHVSEAAEGGDATVMIRMEPGSSYPEHEHQGVEEVLVLAGGYRDGDGEHRAGSYLRYPAGSRHAPVALGDPSAPIDASNPACLLFAVARGGVRLTSEEPDSR